MGTGLSVCPSAARLETGAIELYAVRLTGAPHAAASPTTPPNPRHGPDRTGGGVTKVSSGFAGAFGLGRSAAQAPFVWESGSTQNAK